MKNLVNRKIDLDELVDESAENLLERTRIAEADEIGKRSTNFARYAMQDVEFALSVLGKALTPEEYEQVFKMMMIRKAKNELRKYNNGY